MREMGSRPKNQVYRPLQMESACYRRNFKKTTGIYHFVFAVNVVINVFCRFSTIEPLSQRRCNGLCLILLIKVQRWPCTSCFALLIEQNHVIVVAEYKFSGFHNLFLLQTVNYYLLNYSIIQKPRPKCASLILLCYATAIAEKYFDCQN